MNVGAHLRAHSVLHSVVADAIVATAVILPGFAVVVFLILRTQGCSALQDH